MINDVIRWHEEYPNDWKRTWFEIEKKWTEDIGCPDGVFVPFNIDATVNAAYVVLGLLYGNGDFTKPWISRPGQDRILIVILPLLADPGYHDRV